MHLTSCILETDSHAFPHLSFAFSFGLCAYNFFRAMTLDPVTCHPPKSGAELKSIGDFTLMVILIIYFMLVQIIEDLASEGRLNGQTFCI